MLINDQVNDYGVDDYASFNDNLLYLDYIDKNYVFKERALEPSIPYKFQGNFIGLMNHLDIAPSLYYFTMYINGINNPTDFNGVMPVIKLAIKPPIP